ncbi:MAG: hypothetical protein ACLQVN_09705 [Bryobacteraceae bacterium]
MQNHKSTAVARTTERRTRTRFALHREMRFKLIENDIVIGSGEGVTIDMSSGGVAFLAANPLKTDTFIELSISWPVKLDDQCPVRLVTYGRLLRAEGRRAVCSIDRYEFRTRARVTRPLEPAVRVDPAFYRFVDSQRKVALKTAAACGA